jgi:hypothetical protein
MIRVLALIAVFALTESFVSVAPAQAQKKACSMEKCLSECNKNGGKVCGKMCGQKTANCQH